MSCERRPRKPSAATPTTAIAMVARGNGAPMIAPIATSSPPSAPPTIATIGISVSGIAVPTAAKRLPVAPSPSPSRCPDHSIAFVNRSAPERITAKLASSQTTSISRSSHLREEEGDPEDRVEAEELHALEPVRDPVARRDIGDQDREQDRAELEAVEDERQ